MRRWNWWLIGVVVLTLAIDVACVWVATTL